MRNGASFLRCFDCSVLVERGLIEYGPVPSSPVRPNRSPGISTQTEVKQKALAVLRKQMGDRDEGLAPLADVRKLTYKDLRSGLIANYIEKGNKSLIVRADGEETVPGLKQVDDFFKYSAENPGPSVMQISIETGREFVRRRQAEGAGSAVINRSVACLRRMFKLAYEERKIQSLPVIRLLKDPPARRGFLELPKFEELLAQFPPNLKLYITSLYFCGGRSGEAELIEWSQVDLERKLIRIEDDQTKDKEAREIPLPQRLVLMLERSNRNRAVYSTQPTSGRNGRNGQRLVLRWVWAVSSQWKVGRTIRGSSGKPWF